MTEGKFIRFYKKRNKIKSHKEVKEKIDLFWATLLKVLEEDKKVEASDKESLALSEEKRINTEREEKELNIETDMRYKNLSSTDLFFLEEQTEDKYQSELGISYGEEQRKIFQICKEHLMKLMLKEQIKMEKER